MNARFFALIPCAGSGSRAGATADGMPVPKQYRAIAGAPLVCHTLAAFAAVPRLAAVLVVVAPGDRFFEQRNASVLIAYCGGSTRAASVFNGLNALRNQGAGKGDWVLVHDAARCLVTPAQIDTLIDACEHDAVGGLLAQPLADTLQCSDGDRAVAPLDRAGKWLAQTPQMFRIGPLAEALRRAGPAVTDEASAMETLGVRPLLVRSSALNFKVTYAEDFALAEAVLRSRA